MSDFPEEVKLKTAKEFINSSKNIMVYCREIEVHSDTLISWVKSYAVNLECDNEFERKAKNDAAIVIERLEKEVAELTKASFDEKTVKMLLENGIYNVGELEIHFRDGKKDCDGCQDITDNNKNAGIIIDLERKLADMEANAQNWEKNYKLRQELLAELETEKQSLYIRLDAHKKKIDELQQENLKLHSVIGLQEQQAQSWQQEIQEIKNVEPAVPATFICDFCGAVIIRYPCCHCHRFDPKDDIVTVTDEKPVTDDMSIAEYKAKIKGLQQALADKCGELIDMQEYQIDRDRKFIEVIFHLMGMGERGI